MRITVDNVFVCAIEKPFHRKFYSKWDKICLKFEFFEKGVVDFARIKCSISEKSLRFDKWALLKKSIKTGSNTFEAGVKFPYCDGICSGMRGRTRKIMGF